MGMSAQEIDKNAWLQELLDQRIALKRQLFSADSQSATISGGSGSKSFTSRSVAELKEKIAAIENEIVGLCGELGVEVPFKPARGVHMVKVRFQ